MMEMDSWSTQHREEVKHLDSDCVWQVQALRQNFDNVP